MTTETMSDPLAAEIRSLQARRDVLSHEREDVAKAAARLPEIDAGIERIDRALAALRPAEEPKPRARRGWADELVLGAVPLDGKPMLAIDILNLADGRSREAGGPARDTLRAAFNRLREEKRIMQDGVTARGECFRLADPAAEVALALDSDAVPGERELAGATS
jgi:hypothetical protein